jgi:hypothetical protein
MGKDADMRVLSGPRLLVAGLAILYGVFWLWYGGQAAPLAQEEVDALIASIERSSRTRGGPDLELLEALRAVGEADDGHEFYMVNLMRIRKKALYPDGYDFGEDVRAAARRYAAGIVPELLKRASFPVFLGAPTSLFLQPEGADEWDQVGIVRYRSRRDLLEMVAEPGLAKIGVHKWAYIEKTQVFPVRPVISFIWIRSAVAVLLALLGGLLHVVLRNASWYRPV